MALATQANAHSFVDKAKYHPFRQIKITEAALKETMPVLYVCLCTVRAFMHWIFHSTS